MKKPIHLNDGNHQLSTLETESALENVFVSIPVYFDVDDYGQIHIDVESMMDEFQRHVYGLETIVDNYNEDLK